MPNEINSTYSFENCPSISSWAFDDATPSWHSSSKRRGQLSHATLFICRAPNGVILAVNIARFTIRSLISDAQLCTIPQSGRPTPLLYSTSFLFDVYARYQSTSSCQCPFGDNFHCLGRHLFAPFFYPLKHYRIATALLHFSIQESVCRIKFTPSDSSNYSTTPSTRQVVLTNASVNI